MTALALPAQTAPGFALPEVFRTRGFFVPHNRARARRLRHALQMRRSVAALLVASEARACERLLQTAGEWQASGPASVTAFHESLRDAHQRYALHADLADEDARQRFEAQCADLYAISHVRALLAPARAPLLERVALPPLAEGSSLELRLRLMLVGHFGTTLRQSQPHLRGILKYILRLLRRRQTILAMAAEVDGCLREALGPDATAPAMVGAPGFIFEALERSLGLHVYVSARAISVLD